MEQNVKFGRESKGSEVLGGIIRNGRSEGFERFRCFE
jgi:hypothetical protein